MNSTTTDRPSFFSTGEIWESPTGNRYRVSDVTADLVRFDPVDGGVQHWWNRSRVGRWVRVQAAGEG
jgi:hypothetical protein